MKRVTWSSVKSKRNIDEEVSDFELPLEESNSLETPLLSKSLSKLMTKPKRRKQRKTKNNQRTVIENAEEYFNSESNLHSSDDQSLSDSRETERNLLKSIIRLANELQVLKDTNNQYKSNLQFQTQTTWYRIFLDVLIVIAFLRVGNEIVLADGQLTYPIAFNFAVIWIIWTKDYHYTTRFDTTDLPSRLATLLTFLVVLYGISQLSSAPETYEFGTGLMVAGATVASIHLCLHVRIAYLHGNSPEESRRSTARKYTAFYIVLNVLEIVSWMTGIFLVPERSSIRFIIYLIAIIFSIRLPSAFIANDFHAASYKRGVLVTLLLVFLLQNIMTIAFFFFDFQSASMIQVSFLVMICFILYGIQLVYRKNDTLNFLDHARYTNSFFGFLFKYCHYALLLSVTTLGVGLGTLTESYLSSTIELSDISRGMVMGGFSGMIGSLFVMHILHFRRIRISAEQKYFFDAIYFVVQPLFNVTIIALTAYFSKCSNSNFMALNEMKIVLLILVLILVIIGTSWLDDVLKWSLRGNLRNTNNNRANALGFCRCCCAKEDQTLSISHVNGDVPNSNRLQPEVEQPRDEAADSLNGEKNPVPVQVESEVV